MFHTKASIMSNYRLCSFILWSLIYFYFWDHNIITIFPLPFPLPFRSTSNSWHLLSLIIICKYVYTYAYIPKYHLLSPCSVTLFSWLNIWPWTTNRCVLSYAYKTSSHLKFRVHCRRVGRKNVKARGWGSWLWDHVSK